MLSLLSGQKKKSKKEEIEQGSILGKHPWHFLSDAFS